MKALIDILSEIPDFRKAKGKRHPLSAILAQACVAIMCGARSLLAIADWGRNYDKEFMKSIGYTHEKTPCVATFHNVFKKIDIKLLERKLGQWAHNILENATDCDDKAISIDGKSLRGSIKQGASIVHLLSAVSHKLGLTVAQCSVDGKTNEIGSMDEMLKNLVLEGKIITADAMHTQRKTCQSIIDGGGDYVMLVKDNQRQLLDDVMTTFHGPFSCFLEMSSDIDVNLGHGRIENRKLTVSDSSSDYIDWPGLKQVFMVERKVIFKNGKNAPSHEIVYGITSLSKQQADASRLQELVRCHWHIENRSYWVRDVTFDEDRSQVRSGNIPQVLSALRNTAIGLLRLSGMSNIASACRRFAARPANALKLIGINS